MVKDGKGRLRNCAGRESLAKSAKGAKIFHEDFLRDFRENSLSLSASLREFFSRARSFTPAFKPAKKQSPQRFWRRIFRERFLRGNATAGEGISRGDAEGAEV